ncbi:MAG: T9SS type A sorting domain-containing protein [Flavobacteriales bacterium]|nr:T9SS type A sorting domain-containing protein [Flavobacteriales bacterium]
MKRLLTLLCIAAALSLPRASQAQLPCTGVGMGATTIVNNAAWTANVVPPNMTITRACNITNGLTAIAIGTCNAALNGAVVSGPGIQPGTTLSGACGASTLSLPATATLSAVTLTFTLPGYVSNFPPQTTGTPSPLHCSVCPSLFTTNICTNQYASLYMCAGNVYTISLCSSGSAWNSTLSITSNNASTFAATTGGYVTSNDDGCSPSGHAELVFVPTATNIYFVRVFSNVAGNPCVSNPPLNCGTLTVTCSPAPPAPANDNPCGATPLTVNSACTTIGSTTSWATGTGTPGNPGCGSYAGFDVWFSAVVPASGRLSLQTFNAGATDLAMAVYTAPACNEPVAGNWTLRACNADIAPGFTQPYVFLNNIALAGQTVYIRVWPQSIAGNGGTFEICAFEPVAPANDNCGAFPVAVTAGCTPVVGTNLGATPSGLALPACWGSPSSVNDIWYTVQVPVGAGVNIALNSLGLTDLAVQAYLGVCGTLTPIAAACSDPAFPAQPTLQILQNGTTIVDNTIIYVRVIHRNDYFDNFTICATPALPPANNEPCGALDLPLNYGCVWLGGTNTQATNTAVSLGGQHSNVPAPAAPCAGTATNDVWYTINVPSLPAGTNVVLDTYAGSLSNAAMAVYTGTGLCTGTLALTQVGCATQNVTTGSAMPILTLTSGTQFPALTATTLYVRVWREGGPDGTFQICARRTDPPPGNCFFTLRMIDSAGDGWNGSFVTVCVGAACTNYTLTAATSTINIPANIGQIVSWGYTAAGGFQNQNSFQILAQNGGVLYTSGSPPTVGNPLGAFTVNATCNVPPAPQEDCIGAVNVCSNTAQSANPQNTGGVVDLNLSNRGCLITNERRGVWYTFQITQPGQLGFTINPFPYGISDYDYGLWGPYSSITCPPTGPPLRCSWADGPSLTGLNWVATDFSEGVAGDSWTQYINVAVGQFYILYVDNWYMTGFAFDLNFTYQPNCGVGANPPCASIDCSLLPVEFIDLWARPIGTAINVEWSTASERGSSHFMVQRSLDGTNYETIGRQEAAGQSDGRRNYSFIDPKPHKGLQYYRIEQFDSDGRSSYSASVPAYMGADGSKLTVFPNPARDEVNLNFETEMEGNVHWFISDGSGRTVRSGNLSTDAGSQTTTIGLSGLDGGAYTISMMHADRSVSRARFVKQ